MYLTISSRIILRTFRHDFCRYLSVQPNNNNSNNSSNEIPNFRRRFENPSTSFPLFKQPFKNSFCSTPSPLFTSFQRNYTKEVQDPLANLDKANEVDVSNLREIRTFDQQLEETFSFIGNTADTLSDTTLVKCAEEIFLEIHNITGLPWWASIALTAFFVRTVLVLPYSIYQIKVMGKLEMVSLHMQKIEKKLSSESDLACKRYGWPKEIAEEKYNKAIKDQKNFLLAKENCQPAKCLFLSMVQVPTWIVFSVALRNLTVPPAEGVAPSNTYVELSNDGFGWVSNLTAIDPLALPIILGVIYFVTIEVHRLFRIEPFVDVECLKCTVMQLLGISLVVISSSSSAALSIYWISSASYGLIQAFLLNTQTSYRLLNIPVLGTPAENPYQLFRKNLKNRFKKKKKASLIIIEKK